jgi:protein-disulfide isomerase
MKKLLLILILMFSSVSNTSAEVNRIISGKENAKITIIAYESLTCSHCASFHEDVYPQLKKDY